MDNLFNSPPLNQPGNPKNFNEGPLRASDSWSTTEVRNVSHSHVWTVKGFSQCDCRYLETTVKPVTHMSPAGGSASSAPPNLSLLGSNSLHSSSTTISTSANSGSAVDLANLMFRIRLHPQGNKESNKDFTFFQVFCNTQSCKFRAKFTVYNGRNEEINTTVYTGTQQLHGYFEYIRRDLLLQHIAPEDELHLVLSLTITFDTVTRSSQAIPRPCPPEPKPHEVARDLDKMFTDAKLTDFVITIGGRSLHAHKAILAARSPVFAAMLEPHTAESENNSVTIEDIEYETMQELLHYMYSGRAPMLNNMAAELLAAADRYALPGLKEMAEQVLRFNVSTENVCRALILADMHDARELKTESIKFIAHNAPAVIQTDGWQEILGRQLMTEVALAISGVKVEGKSPEGEPMSKKNRLSGFGALMGGN